MLSAEEKEEILKEASLFPAPEAVCIDALKIVQHHRGWVSDEAIKDVAELLGMPAAKVDSVATFYTRIYRRPVGRNVILICESVSCMIMGYETIYKYISEKLGIHFGETTADGRFTLLPNSCFSNCNHAPAMMINDELYNNLSVNRIDELLGLYK